MAVKITRAFEPADRYVYDFGLCSIDKGWAQMDSSQDAGYYGNWVNPFKLALVCYCEGDVILTQCETPDEFVEEINKFADWNRVQGHRFIGLDPGFNRPLGEELHRLGLIPEVPQR